ncbi:MAG TPA: DUF948 domain-containing protein [Nitrospiraceae bacterium]|nr:DUF948 domain-containing protein [Nitrospiraceae bacterium]
MIVEIAALLIATAFAVLVGYLVPMLIQLRKTIAESEQLLAHMSSELPSLVREMRTMTENVNAVADQARNGVEHASVFLHAVGEIGDTVQQVHETVRGRSGSLLVNVASMVAGLKAASAVVKERMNKEGGNSNGR